jgi:hypothetical protein
LLLRDRQIAAIACLKREKAMFGILAEPDRRNALTPRDFANGARRCRLAAVRVRLDAALPT